MKKVVALSGTGTKGKSQTIRKAAELLSNFAGAKVEDQSRSRGADIKVVITINGIKIGVESQGDPRPGRLPESLAEFVEINCEIIVCATRSYGGTVNAVRNLEAAHGYEVVWFQQKDAGESKSKQEAAN